MTLTAVTCCHGNQVLPCPSTKTHLHGFRNGISAVLSLRHPQDSSSAVECSLPAELSLTPLLVSRELENLSFDGKAPNLSLSTNNVLTLHLYVYLILVKILNWLFIVQYQEQRCGGVLYETLLLLVALILLLLLLSESIQAWICYYRSPVQRQRPRSACSV